MRGATARAIRKEHGVKHARLALRRPKKRLLDPRCYFTSDAGLRCLRPRKHEGFHQLWTPSPSTQKATT